jgi:hypothetical protein
MWRDDDNAGIVLEMSGDLRGTRHLLWTVQEMPWSADGRAASRGRD